MSAIGPLQVAIIARLVADAGVGAIAGDKIYENVAKPDPVTGAPPELPWITVDGFTGVEEGSALGAVGFGHTAGVHAFAEGDEGNKKVTALANAVKAALRAPLTLTGHTSTRLKLDFEAVLEEAGGTRHAPMRFRVNAWETA